MLSHWFFRLSQGGNGTNDIHNTFSVCPIGIDAAQRIVYRAETNWLHAGANYAAARNAMISASTELFGANSSQTINVTNAWHAVGVGARYTGDAGLTVRGNSELCSSATYTVNAPAGSAVVWSATSGIVNINAATGSAKGFKR